MEAINQRAEPVQSTNKTFFYFKVMVLTGAAKLWIQ